MVQRGSGLRWFGGPGAGCRRGLAHLGPKRHRPHPRLLGHDTRGEERLPSPRSEWLTCAAPAATRTRYQRLRVKTSFVAPVRVREHNAWPDEAFKAVDELDSGIIIQVGTKAGQQCRSRSARGRVAV